MSIKRLATKRGDTMIEVIFAVAIFGLLSVMAIATMNNALGRAEGNLENSMARSEIDAQAEALRFIHASALSEMSGSSSDRTYRNKWNELTDKSQNDYSTAVYQDGADCDTIRSGDVKPNSFALDISSGLAMIKSGNILAAGTYPTITGGNAYGIWINVKAGDKSSNGIVKYYDFYIHTCFDAVGSSTATKLDSTVRLSNPNYTSS